MMELTENKKEKGIWKLPKNVRQIGEPGSSTRILIEDYAYTYLHQDGEQNLTWHEDSCSSGKCGRRTNLYSGSR